MVTSIALPVLQNLLAHGAQLIEVLPAQEYDEQHLPGALHIPLKTLDASSAAVLDRARPVIVYCWGHHLHYAIVTDPEGHLLGTVHPVDLC